MTQREGQQWVREFVASSARIARLPVVAEDLQTTMQRLARAAPAIIRHTHGSNTRAAAREAVEAATVRGAGRGRGVDRDQARWWGVDVAQGSTRTPGEISARAAQESQATRIARDAAKGRDVGRGIDR